MIAKVCVHARTTHTPQFTNLLSTISHELFDLDQNVYLICNTTQIFVVDASDTHYLRTNGRSHP